MQPYDMVFDMETGDPDDALTLCLLATHPWVNLKAVTVFPGGRDQVGMVKAILDRLGKSSVPVGAGTPKKTSVSYLSKEGFYYRWLGSWEDADPDALAEDLLGEFPGASLLTGAPLSNVWEAYKKGAQFSEWTCQGGFVGDNLMPEHLRLPKFRGRDTCPTWNLGGDTKAAQGLLLRESRIPIRRLVPKSVCHGIVYTQEIQARVPSGVHAGLDLFKEGMGVYFAKKPDGKPLHDILAAVCALKPSIGRWIEVQPYYHKGEWGCRALEEPGLDVDRGEDRRAPPTPIFALIELDMGSFEAVLTGANVWSASNV